MVIPGTLEAFEATQFFIFLMDLKTRSEKGIHEISSLSIDKMDPVTWKDYFDNLVKTSIIYDETQKRVISNDFVGYKIVNSLDNNLCINDYLESNLTINVFLAEREDGSKFILLMDVSARKIIIENGEIKTLD